MQEMNDNFASGSIVALVTPFEDGGKRVDQAAWLRLLQKHAQAGTSGIVVAGTTGESATLDCSERDWLLQSAVESVSGRLTMIAGTGSASTATAVALSRRAAKLGADAVLVASPYYNRPPQRGLLAHFRTIADECGVPVVLYNVPSRTAVDIEPETALALAEHPKVVAIKEAVADMGRVRQYAQAGLTVVSGDDPTALEAMRNGAAGVVSVASNIVPKRMVRMCRLAARGDFEAAGECNSRLEPLYRFLAVESNPIAVKWLLSEMGYTRFDLRLPLVGLAEMHHARGRRLLASLAVE